MRISGHKTASTFRRYDIVSEADLDDVAARLDERNLALTTTKTSDAPSSGHEMGMIGKNGTKDSAATRLQIPAPALAN
jgi:hypothetical protein